jgi:hypothetical protein
MDDFEYPLGWDEADVREYEACFVAFLRAISLLDDVDASDGVEHSDLRPASKTQH